MMAKKGQAEFPLRVFSILTFLVVLSFILIIMSLPGCNNRDEVQKSLHSRSEVLLDLRAAEQLSAYLRTDMPDIDTLNDTIDTLSTKQGFIESSVIGTPSFQAPIAIGNDITDAKEFLEQHPEVYVDKTYAGFISAIYVYKDDDQALLTFDVVTKALFHRKLYSESARFGQSTPIFTLYATPEISLKYGKHTVITDPDKTSGMVSLPIDPKVNTGRSLKILPTHDGNGVTVKFRLRQETKSLPKL